MAQEFAGQYMGQTNYSLSLQGTGALRDYQTSRPLFQDWWSSAGRVELNSKMIDMIRNQFSQDDQDLDAMKIYRDELLVKILGKKCC